MKIYYSSILVLFLMSFASIFAQENITPGVSESDWDAIQAQVISILGVDFQVINIVNVDSAVGNRRVADGCITNPYNSLRTCYIFIVQKQNQSDSSFSSCGAIGIYKNGNIIWQSDTIINTSLSIASSIKSTCDLNNDGNVEIISSWFEGAQGGIERLWIFSWNGQAGGFVTAVDNKNESLLVSAVSGFEFVDVNGDNVYEIVGNWYINESDEKMRKTIYSWNGSRYGKWVSSPQPLPNGFYPRNKVEAEIKAAVKNEGGKFSYNYKLQSLSSSKQMINTFVLVTTPDSISNSLSPVDWDFGGVPTKALGWLAPDGFDVFIKPGQTDSSFYFQSNHPPAIIQALVRGDNGNWSSILGDSVEYTIEQWFDEAMTNSFIKTTIGPGILPNPLVFLNFLDTLSSYTIQSRSLGWITTQTIANKYLNYFSAAKTQLQSNNTNGARTTLQQVLTDVNVDSSSTLTSEAYALLRFNTEYLISKLPAQTTPYLNIALKNSSGVKLTGGTLQYYDASWKDAVNNNDGTFSINTTKTSLSLRMTYAYGSQQKNNVAVNSDTVIFQTVNAQVQLKNSNGILIDTGTVQYYAGAWRSFGTTSNGIATKELLAGSYTFRMLYGYASVDTVQDLNANPMVVFKTTNAELQLKNSLGDFIDQGSVQYYSGAWRTFGTTVNGVATKELLPTNYTFRMTYAYGSNDKAQNIKTNRVVLFQTNNAQVQLKNSLGSFIDQGTVQYYSGAWRDFGVTTNGVVTKELLPNNYSFRMTYAYGSNDKAQDLNVNSTVLFQTVNTSVQLKNSVGDFIDQGTAQYYSGAWRDFGTTTNGVVTRELLPNNYSFRMTYAFASNDKAQNLNTNTTVVFQTVNASVQLKNSLGNFIDQGSVQYYSGAWRTFGATLNGVVTKELLPNSYPFRMTHEFVSIDKTQNVGSDNTVIFSTVPATVQVKNLQNNPVNDATVTYYSGAWRSFGTTINGQAVKELLPVNLQFRAKLGTAQADKTQNLLTNPLVEIQLP